MSSRDAGSCGPEGTPRAAAALCSLYREAGQRLQHLQEQLAARDALVKRLRARLSALEGDAAPSLVDALLEQVARLREQLQEQESGAAEAALRQVRGASVRADVGCRARCCVRVGSKVLGGPWHARSQLCRAWGPVTPALAAELQDSGLQALQAPG